MFISCPHCRELVAIDRISGLTPAMCPRCGGALQKATEATPSEVSTEDASVDDASVDGRSLASFLRGDDEIPAVASEVDVDPQNNVTETTTDEETLAYEISVAPVAQNSPVTATPAPHSGLPSFTLQNTRSSNSARTPKWQWLVLLLLTLSLAIQVLLADRVRLSADENWRPLIVSLCKGFGCVVPAWHQPGAISMLSRDVSPIPGSIGGLNVQATFRNDARWAQALPVLLLSLSDADGRIVGSRAFTPREYLGEAATKNELAPGQSAQVTLKLYEPNPSVAAFSFDFR